MQIPAHAKSRLECLRTTSRLGDAESTHSTDGICCASALSDCSLVDSYIIMLYERFHCLLSNRSQQEISHRQGLSKVLPYNPARVCRALTNWSKRLSCKGAFAKAWFSGVIG
jgi:hypothetical protein